MSRYSEFDLLRMQEFYSLILDKAPSLELLARHYSNDDSNELEDHVGEYMKKEIVWSTIIGLVEAAERILQEAHDNANFK